MTPETRAVLLATPGSRSNTAHRAADIARYAEQEPMAVKPVLERLVGMGLVESRRVPRDLLYFRTAQGDRVAAGGRS
ncbi:hypothetical protein [Azospirillum picis]|uniref:DNA-binding MarR family transcriptional regulator n=1 Tax=Azospirillum picis TaxID=488438 RepID=A0ABU0MQI7_9PROT|nr:hypothetical protein [Azospirillum picis]MBP2301549.1 DNA-binding MarR family transcriptional regulator [Azospirillum picis]MDQ0535381.1 DNA-binding MarR family transcriptional regulator [Azospirillum picis]